MCRITDMPLHRRLGTGSERRAERRSSKPSNVHEDLNLGVPPPPPPAAMLPLGASRPRDTSPSFYCPLTMAMMTDPVQDREGNSYEKSAIVKWLSSNTTSPITRNRLRKKHLIPNRALKEAIDFEVKRQNEILQIAKEGKEHFRQKHSPPSAVNPPAIRFTTLTSIIPSSLSLPARISTNNENEHLKVINDFLSRIGVKGLDQFGIAFLPMSKICRRIDGERVRMTIIVEARAAVETFQLYTHLDANLDCWRHALLGEEENALVADGSNDVMSDNDNGVLDELLQRGKHKSLTLAAVSENRVRFGFKGQNAEIKSSATRLRAILNMFAKVAFLMKKRMKV